MGDTKMCRLGSQPCAGVLRVFKYLKVLVVCPTATRGRAAKENHVIKDLK